MTTSYATVSKNIADALAKDSITSTVQHWMNTPDSLSRVLIVGSCIEQTCQFLWRYDNPSTRVIFYCTAEGTPILTHASMEALERDNMTIITPSNYVKNCLENMGITVDAVIPHAVPMRDFLVSDVFVDEIHRQFPSRKIIANISHNNIRKRIDKLLLAFCKVSYIDNDAFLILHSNAGPPGYMGADIERYMKELEIRRCWYTRANGLWGEGKVNAIYKVAMVYVMSSMAEGFGLPIIEAFRFGVPVIAVDAPPMNEILTDHYTGLLVPSDKQYVVNLKDMMYCRMYSYEVQELADRITTLLIDEELRSKLSSNIQNEKMNWDSDVVYKRFEEYI